MPSLSDTHLHAFSFTRLSLYSHTDTFQIEGKLLIASISTKFSWRFSAILRCASCDWSNVAMHNARLRNRYVNQRLRKRAPCPYSSRTGTQQKILRYLQVLGLRHKACIFDKLTRAKVAPILLLGHTATELCKIEIKSILRLYDYILALCRPSEPALTVISHTTHSETIQCFIRTLQARDTIWNSIPYNRKYWWGFNFGELVIFK